MKILDYETQEPVTVHGDAIEIQSDGGDVLFRLRLVDDALDIAIAGNDFFRTPGIHLGMARLAIFPIGADRVIARRDRRERG